MTSPFRLPEKSGIDRENARRVASPIPHLEPIRPISAVNSEIQDVSVSRKTLVVTLDKSEVEAVHQSVVAEIAKVASLPGFRPGKVPVAVVAKRFAKEIEGEFKSKVVNKAYEDGLEQSKLEVFSVVDVKEGLVQLGLSAAVTFTVDLRPEFKSPEYNQTLADLFIKATDFIVAKNEVFQDILQILPVPTYKEVDELYRDLHALKKRVRELEQQVNPA